MRFNFEAAGDPLQIMMAKILAAERAVSRGTKAAGNGLKRDWRAQVRSALGYRMAGAIRSRNYPAQTTSINAASLVYAPSKGGRGLSYVGTGKTGATAAEVIDAHDRGATIRSRDGFFLAIPLGNAARMRGASTTGRGDRTRITPGGWERRTGRLLRMIYRKGENSLLVDDGGVTPGNTMKWRGGRGGGRYKTIQPIKRKKIIPIFVLVPQVRLQKKMDLDRDTRRWGNLLPALIVQNWKDV